MAFCVVMLLFEFYFGCRGFCHSTESDLFLLLLNTCDVTKLASSALCGWFVHGIHITQPLVLSIDKMAIRNQKGDRTEEDQSGDSQPEIQTNLYLSTDN